MQPAGGVDTSHYDYEGVARFVEAEVCSQAQVVSTMGSSMAFMLPREQVTVSRIFNRMEANKAAVGVLNWGITQASLEEVFVKVATLAEAEEEQLQQQ